MITQPRGVVKAAAGGSAAIVQLGKVMSGARVLSEFVQFLREEKKYWLLPIVIVLVLFGLLIVFAQSSALAPFIYTLF